MGDIYHTSGSAYSIDDQVICTDVHSVTYGGFKRQDKHTPVFLEVIKEKEPSKAI